MMKVIRKIGYEMMNGQNKAFLNYQISVGTLKDAKLQDIKHKRLKDLAGTNNIITLRNGQRLSENVGKKGFGVFFF